MDWLKILFGPANVGLDGLDGVLERVHSDTKIWCATNKVLDTCQIVVFIESARAARDQIRQSERCRAVLLNELVPELFHVVVCETSANRVGRDCADVRDAVLFTNEGRIRCLVQQTTQKNY